MPSARPGIEALLAERARALHQVDLAALLAGVTPEARTAQREALARMVQVPFADVFYRLTDFEEPGPADRLTATAEFGFRLQDVDDHPAVMARKLSFVRAGGGWLLSGDQPTGPSALWDQGVVHAVRGKHSLVLGPAGESELAPTVAVADRAVPAVSEVWGTGWAGRLLVEIPATEVQFAQLLGVPAADYQGIAAVTTAAAGAPLHAPADRVLINPEAFAGLTELGRRVVTTHEATHVATRADTRAWTPLWLSEGVADFTGYRGTGRTPRQIAPELARDVAAGRIPQSLPADADFAAGSAGIAQAYELSWLACDLIARRFGTDRLVAFYRAVGAEGPPADRDVWLDRVMRDRLGPGIAEFTKLWVAETARLAG
ncbi:hypothetical protein GCM10010193_04350 [Kitasatospora atroaurantiaca]|uniref:Basic secretory peptidase family protein n=1 Tax=Kitasatospora atroaurantiaca TaxID=285545 RepID=A0A561EM03_9ACTN|nr:hypothetical protein [Kitasatospora atroaurantiaca]TWE16653.1 hypothetical protein FB465_1636 [Kitasatospora atroaurantiaca]